VAGHRYAYKLFIGVGRSIDKPVEVKMLRSNSIRLIHPLDLTDCGAAKCR